jgi:hypothetical protein
LSRRRLALLLAALALWLALFSALATLGAQAGLWPLPPPGAFRGLEMPAGFLAAAALLAWLLWPARRA